MKMYMIVYDAGYDEDVINAITSFGITGYTKWNRVLGQGEKSDPKMDDGIWPGYNSTIMMTVNMAQEVGINQALQDLYVKLRNRGIRVFSWPIKQVL